MESMPSVSEASRVRATPLRRDLRQADNGLAGSSQAARQPDRGDRGGRPWAAPAAVAAVNLPEPGERGGAVIAHGTRRPYEPFLRGTLSEGLERAGADAPGLKRSTIAAALNVELATLEVYAKPSRTEVIPGDRLVHLLCGGALARAPRTLEWLWGTLARAAGFVAVREPAAEEAGAELSICELAADVGLCAQQLAACHDSTSAGGKSITAGEYAALAGRADEVIRAGLRLRTLCERAGGAR